MAGDWIKFEKATLGKAELYQLAERLRVKPPQALWHLLKFWFWCDEQTQDGVLGGVSKHLVDDCSGCKGFTDALLSVGWLSEEGGLYVVPNFERHNGKSAKKRAVNAATMKQSRKEEDEKRERQKQEEERERQKQEEERSENSTNVENKFHKNTTKSTPEKRTKENNLSIVSPAPSGSGVQERLQADVERVCRILGRRALLSYEAMQAMSEISPIPEEELKAVEWYYSFPKDDHVQELKIRRQSADTLVIHWLEEVDKARAYARTLGISIPENAAKKRTGGGYPEGARAWLCGLGNGDVRPALPGLWTEVAGDLRREWEALSAKEKTDWAQRETDNL